MKPIYFELDDHLPLLIVPESEAHVDGHPVLTYSYAIFKRQEGQFFIDTDSLLAPDKKSDPNYLGRLIFDFPGKLFTYEAAENRGLSDDEVTELIEQLSHYRENPAMWRV